MVDMDKAEEIRELAEDLKGFFLYFDATFLQDKSTETLLEEARKGLQEKISRNNSAMVVITALGGRYDGEEDRAKVEELDALLRLLEARKKLRRLAVDQTRKKIRDETLLRDVFGV